MKNILIKWLVMTAAILTAAYSLEGINVHSFPAAILAAAGLGILNAIFRPIVLILTLPINILSLGLFTFVINAFLLKLVAFIVPGFDVTGFWPAVFGALTISIVSWLLNLILREAGPGGPSRPQQPQSPIRHTGRPDVIDLDKKDGDRWE